MAQGGLSGYEHMNTVFEELDACGTGDGQITKSTLQVRS